MFNKTGREIENKKLRNTRQKLEEKNHNIKQKEF